MKDYFYFRYVVLVTCSDQSKKNIVVRDWSFSEVRENKSSCKYKCKIEVFLQIYSKYVSANSVWPFKSSLALQKLSILFLYLDCQRVILKKCYVSSCHSLIVIQTWKSFVPTRSTNIQFSYISQNFEEDCIKQP